MLPAILQAVSLSTFLFGAFAVFEWMNGHGQAFGSAIVVDARPTTMTILIVLSGFMLGASRYARDAFRREFDALEPSLVWSDAERSEILDESAKARGTGSTLATMIGVAFGVLIIRQDGGPPAILSTAPFNHHLVAGLVVNGILFGLMGRALYTSIVSNRLITSLSRVLPGVDLLDAGSYKPFAQHGLRSAFLWLGGSTIASLLFLDQRHDMVTALVIAATVSFGAFSLFWPLRGGRDAIVRAKRDELARVREQIRNLRHDMLDPTSNAATDASQRLPGLLAYESRIDSVREWPMDVPTIARFGLLVTIAVGSWLGGAVVERLLDVILEG